MSYFDDASLVMIPSGYKDQKVYSVKPIDGSGDLTFSRASNATRVNSSGLVEKVRENLILQSNSFDTTWINSNTSETSGQAGYDGTNNAWLLNITGGTDSQYINQTISTSGSTTFSVYVKAGTKNWVLLLATGGTNPRAFFDLQNGVVGTQIGSVGKIVSVGNGWYRCSISHTESIGSVRIYVATGDDDIAQASGNILIQASQVETGDIATDYIATTTTAVSVGPVSGLPRLDYSGGASCPSLLLEPQRTNVNPYSEQFDNAGWEKTYSTITANATTSPDGYTNADAWFETSDNNWHRLYDNGFSVTSGTAYTCSLFVKPNGRDWVSIEFFAGGGGFNGSRVWFNIANGTIGTTQTGITAKIENYGNGWYRISATQTAASSTTGYILYLLATGDGVVTYAGDPTKGAYVYGGMTEAGAYATSYIPTLSSAVTRVADAASKTGISSLIGQTEGTVFFDWVMVRESASTSEDYYPITISDGTSANMVTLNNYNNSLLVYISSGGSAVFANSSFSGSSGLRIKAAIAYKANDFAFYVNGVQIATDTSGAVPIGLSQLNVNTYFTGANIDDTKVNQLLLFKTRLSNADLATLTA